MDSVDNTRQIKKFQLPDLCRNSAILMTIVMSQVFTIMIYLVQDAQLSFIHFCLLALYLLWNFLGSSALLCACRPWLKQRTLPTGFIISFLLCISIFAVIEFISCKLVLPYIDIHWHWQNIIRHFIIASIFIVLILRFFLLLDMLEQRSQSEIKARIQSLQSRIQPHFLFNSLNTIAELTATNPEQAEKAIYSLSSLFRSSLSDAEQAHSMQAEIDLCKQYIELERWRLGERLRLDWQVDAVSLDKVMVPRLILQPLIENAVLHGVQSNEQGGDVKIRLFEKRAYVEIEVANSYDDKVTQRKKGAGIALDNLQERLYAIYDDKHGFKASEEKDIFKVKLRLPKRMPNVDT